MDVAVLPHPSKDCTDYEDFLRINVLVHTKLPSFHSHYVFHRIVGGILLGIKIF